jgi:hypothetical protein
LDAALQVSGVRKDTVASRLPSKHTPSIASGTGSCVISAKNSALSHTVATSCTGVSGSSFAFLALAAIAASLNSAAFFRTEAFNVGATFPNTVSPGARALISNFLPFIDCITGLFDVDVRVVDFTVGAATANGSASFAEVVGEDDATVGDDDTAAGGKTARVGEEVYEFAGK